MGPKRSEVASLDTYASPSAAAPGSASSCAGVPAHVALVQVLALVGVMLHALQHHAVVLQHHPVTGFQPIAVQKSPHITATSAARGDSARRTQRSDSGWCSTQPMTGGRPPSGSWRPEMGSEVSAGLAWLHRNQCLGATLRAGMKKAQPACAGRAFGVTGVARPAYRVQPACWMPANTQPLPWRGLVRCQISSNVSSSEPAPKRIKPVNLTLTT